MRNFIVMRYLTVLLLVPVLFFACKKDPAPGPLPDHTHAAFAARVDSVVYAFNTTDTNYLWTATVNRTFFPAPAPHTSVYNSQLYNPWTLRPSFVITKGTLHHGDSIPSDSAFIQFFQPGVYPYSVNADSGFQVLWVDLQGTLWNTSEMSGYQGNHQMRIVSSSSFYENGVCVVKFKVNFSCTLYHPAYPSIELIDGWYEGYVKNE